MLEQITFDDGQGHYPFRISAYVPRELRREAEAVAERQGISLGEFARRALMSALDQHGGKRTPAEREAQEAAHGR